MTGQFTSKNIFNIIGFKGQEATNLIIRAQLMRASVGYIKSESLTQDQAAQRFGIAPPRIDDLIRGKISLFSVDTLVNMLDQAGFDIKISFSREKIVDLPAHIKRNKS